MHRDLPTSAALLLCLVQAPCDAAARSGEASCSAPIASASELSRAWTPEDSIAIRYVLGPGPGIRIGPDPDALFPSPDGKYLFFIAGHGDVLTDSNVNTLNVFDVRAIRAALQSRIPCIASPFRKVEMRSQSSEQALPINSPHWDSSGNGVWFEGLDANNISQVMYLDLSSGGVRQLTNNSREMRWSKADGDGLVYLDFEPFVPPPPQYPAVFAPRSKGLVRDPADDVFLKSNRRVWAIYKGGAPREITGVAADILGFRPLSISPDGRRIVMPSSDHTMFSLVDVMNAAASELTPRGSLRVGETRVPGPDALWSIDSKHVVLVNARMPDSKSKADAAYIVDYDIERGVWTKLQPIAVGSDANVAFVSNVSWVTPGKHFVVRTRMSSGKEATAAYRYSEGRWRSGTASADLADRHSLKMDGIDIALEQGENKPPRVWARLGNSRTALLAPDPALDGLAVAKTATVHWQEADGHVEEGGLTLPPGYDAKRPLPLIIQTYGYSPDLFLPDGNNPTSDARQVFAARGFAVLQVGHFLDLSTLSNAPDEGPRMVDRIDRAVTALSAKGIVDPTKVGLIGFSHMGFNTLYAATHPGKIKLAAAVAADSWTGTYDSYLNDGVSRGVGETERMYGGPFWQAKKMWLDHEPSFNFDKIQTPLLLSTNGGSGTPQFSAITVREIGGLTLNRKPFEYIYFPKGSHRLQRPAERLAMMNAVVDWMQFWLTGRENDEHSKHQQYIRWRIIREEWKTQQAWEAKGNPVGSKPETPKSLSADRAYGGANQATRRN